MTPTGMFSTIWVSCAAWASALTFWVTMLQVSMAWV